MVFSDKTAEDEHDELAKIDAFELDMRSLGDVQVRLAEAANEMIKTIENELKLEHKVSGDAKEKMETTLAGFIDDLSEIQMRLLELDVNNIKERRKLVDLIEIFGAMIKTIREYLDGGPHKSILERVGHRFKKLNKHFANTLKEYGSHMKSIGRYFALRGFQFEADDDDSNESKNVFFSAIPNADNPRQEIINQLKMPLAQKAVNPKATTISFYNSSPSTTSSPGRIKLEYKYPHQFYLL